jgi:hypothetical protein
MILMHLKLKTSNFRAIAIAEECRMNFTTTSVSIDRKDLTKWTELCESSRIKLSKSEVCNFLFKLSF